MIKYKATIFSDEPKAVEIVRETEKTVFIFQKDGWRKNTLVATRKEITSEAYCDTWQEAKDWMIKNWP
jgi:hypothetical protein